MTPHSFVVPYTCVWIEKQERPKGRSLYIYIKLRKEGNTMKSLFEHNGGTYCKQGDYLIPNLELPKSEEINIGIYRATLAIPTRVSQTDLY